MCQAVRHHAVVLYRTQFLARKILGCLIGVVLYFVLVKRYGFVVGDDEAPMYFFHSL